MKWLLSNFLLVFVSFSSFAQELMSEAEKKIIENKYGELYYGNKQFSIDAFYEQDSLKYVYSKSNNKVFILDKQNKIVAEHRIRFKDISLPHFSQVGERVLLSVFGEDESVAYFKNINIIKKENKRNRKIMAQKQVECIPGTIFIAQQLFVSQNKPLSKVLLLKKKQKTDTLYKDIKTKENRTVNTSPRAELLAYNEKVYFFDADQRLLLSYSFEGKLIDSISFKKQEDEYIKTFMLNFLLDTQTGKFYLSTVNGDNTFIYEIGSQGIVRRYEIPFRIYFIHQIYQQKVFFSMNTENKNYYIYQRNLE
jgi:hypothetical protein